MALRSESKPIKDFGQGSNESDIDGARGCCNLVKNLFLSCFGPGDKKQAPGVVDSPHEAPHEATGSSDFYHVFISHRGPDVKKTFVDTLREFLTRERFSSFVDYAELREGESSWPAIVGALRNSKLYVVVLSPGYAESNWCLDELNEIMENDEQRTLPVFYNVQPEEVRAAKGGRYATALTDHGLGQESQDQVERWRRSLNKVSLISGFRLDQTSGYDLCGFCLSCVSFQVDRIDRPFRRGFLQGRHLKSPIHGSPRLAKCAKKHLVKTV